MKAHPESLRWRPGAFQSSAFQAGKLVIELGGKTAEHLGTSVVEVRELADRVLEFCEKLVSREEKPIQKPPAMAGGANRLSEGESRSE